MTAARWLRVLPGPLAIHLTVLSALVVLVTLAHGLADTDYWWHLTTGRLIAERGALPTTDPFSFTWAGRPWTTHEWLSELLIYLLVSRLGVTVALVVFGLIAAGGLVIVALALRARGRRSLPIALASAVGAWVIFSYATVRPQAISWLLLGVLVALLLVTDAAHARRLLLLPLLFLAWANLHGLYVIGLGVLGVYALLTVLRATPLAGRPGWPWGSLAASFAASALTPAGPAGLLYPLRYLEPGDWGLKHISEWQSPNFHDPTHLSLLVLVLATVGIGARRVPAWVTVLALAGVAGALVALRNAPLAAVLAMPAVATGLDGLLRSRRSAAREPPAWVALTRRAMELALAVVVVVAAALIVPRLTGVTGIFERSFPVAGIDRLVKLDPDARVMAEYGWGGYAIHRLYDAGGRVFVDGRNDMYDQAILEDYTAIRNADAGWPDHLARYRVDAILLPPAASLTRGPIQAAGWCEAYRDDLQVLLLPSCPPH